MSVAAKAGACPYATEAELVACFIDQMNAQWPGKEKSPWTIYPETGGWDLLLAHDDGYQLGIEAKLSLNAKVIDQALIGQHRPEITGPDYRAVLVPAMKIQKHLGNICNAIGIKIIGHYPPEANVWRSINLPTEDYSYGQWPNWCPAARIPLPDYVPDVTAGIASPIQLTPWKVKAIQLMIVLERRGWVDRGDMKALDISPSRWTDGFHGFLTSSERGKYVRCERTPDLRAQHPTNYGQIEADAAIWGKKIDPFGNEAPAFLLTPSPTDTGD